MRPNEGYQIKFAKEKEAGNGIQGTSYTLEEYEAVQANLTRQLGPEYVSSRPGPAGKETILICLYRHERH